MVGHPRCVPSPVRGITTATMAIRRRMVLVGLIAALLAGACGTSSFSEATPEVAAETASLLDGSFSTISGDAIELSDLQGDDVVLWFWAPW